MKPSEFGMVRRSILLLLICVLLLFCSVADAQCSVDTVRVKGKIAHATTPARVRVQLLYAKKEHEESATADVEGGAFDIPVEFLTQSHRALINRLGEKCNRRPTTVTVSLMEGDQETDSVSLDFLRDFEKSDPSAYTVRHEILLHGQER